MISSIQPLQWHSHSFSTFSFTTALFACWRLFLYCGRDRKKDEKTARLILPDGCDEVTARWWKMPANQTSDRSLS
jgi:hypothetical protein